MLRVEFIGRRVVPFLSLAIALGCSEPPPEEEILRPVRSELVRAGGGARVRSFSGTARAGQETNLRSRRRAASRASTPAGIPAATTGRPRGRAAHRRRR